MNAYVCMTEAGVPQEPRRGRKLDWVVQFEGQMLVCGILAKALYGVPDEVWLGRIARQRLFDEIPFGSDLPEISAAFSKLQGWTEAVSGSLDDARFVAVRDDYTRLFIGPGQLQAAPWESVYTNKDRAMFQRETLSVKNWYQRFDLVLESSYNEPADHVGLEFAFLAHLAKLTIAASDIRDGGEVKRLIDAQRGFLSQHMLRWVPRWADDVVRYARTDLYCGLGWLARGTVLEAASFFSAEVAKAKQQGAFQRSQSGVGEH
jgi:putative dimethyl sulfoxide reductase chaperone